MPLPLTPPPPPPAGGPLLLGSCWPLVPPLTPPLLLLLPVDRDTGVLATEWARRCTTPGIPHAVVFGATPGPHGAGAADPGADDSGVAAAAALPPS